MDEWSVSSHSIQVKRHLRERRETEKEDTESHQCVARKVVVVNACTESEKNPAKKIVYGVRLVTLRF